jgi:hypothetical protein
MEWKIDNKPKGLGWDKNKDTKQVDQLEVTKPKESTAKMGI